MSEAFYATHERQEARGGRGLRLLLTASDERFFVFGIVFACEGSRDAKLTA